MKAERVAQTFNGKVPWLVDGSYFKLLSTVNPVTVELFKAGQRVLYAAGAEGGFYQRIAFDRVEITTGGNEEVAWIYAPAEGGSDRFTGVMDVTDRAARLLGIVYGSLGQLAQAAIGGANAAQVTERGFVYGAAFASTTALAGATNETVLAPGSNTNGVIVWEAEICSGQSAGAAQVGLLAKSSAPASAIDGDVLLAYAHNMVTAVGITQGKAQRDRPVFVASGKGLYFRNATASAEAVAYRKVLYTVL